MVVADRETESFWVKKKRRNKRGEYFMESEKQLLQHKQSCRGSELILLYIYTSYSFDHSTVTASL